MRRKLTARTARSRDEPPADQAGLTIDWIGVQETGTGGASLIPAWLVAGLAAIRAAPALAWSVSRRLAKARHDREPRQGPRRLP